MAFWQNLGSKTLSLFGRRNAPLTKQQTTGYRASVGVVPFWSSLSGGWGSFGLGYVEEMLQDPQVRLCLEFRKAPLFSAEFKIEANSPEVGHYVEDMHHKFWEEGLNFALASLHYGYMTGEWLYEESNGYVKYAGIAPIHPRDVKLYSLHGKLYQVHVHHIDYDADHEGDNNIGDVILDGPLPNRPSKAFWFTNDPIYNKFYGRSALQAAWWSWRLKAMPDGAMESLFKWMYKHSITCTIVRHPDGIFDLGNGRTVQAQDLARQMVEQVKAGGVIAMNSVRDEHGQYLWDVQEWAKLQGEVGPLIEYVQFLDTQIQRGAGIPDEVITHEGNSGGYSRSQVAASSFFLTAERDLHHVITAEQEQMLKPSVHMNFGPKATFKIKPAPLIPPEQAQGQPGQGAEQPPPGPAPGGAGPPPAMTGAGWGGQQAGQDANGDATGDEADFSKFAKLSLDPMKPKKPIGAPKEPQASTVRVGMPSIGTPSIKAPVQPAAAKGVVAKPVGSGTQPAGKEFWSENKPSEQIPPRPPGQQPGQPAQSAAGAKPPSQTAAQKPPAPKAEQFEGAESLSPAGKTAPTLETLHPEVRQKAAEFFKQYEGHPTHKPKLEVDAQGRTAIVVRDKDGNVDPQQSRLVPGDHGQQAGQTDGKKPYDFDAVRARYETPPKPTERGQVAAAPVPAEHEVSALHQRLQTGESMHGGSPEETAAEQVHDRGFRDPAHTKQAMMMVGALKANGLQGRDLDKAVQAQIDEHFPEAPKTQFKAPPKDAAPDDAHRHWMKEMTRNLKQRGYTDRDAVQKAGQLVHQVMAGPQMPAADGRPGHADFEKELEQLKQEYRNTPNGAQGSAHPAVKPLRPGEKPTTEGLAKELTKLREFSDEGRERIGRQTVNKKGKVIRNYNEVAGDMADPKVAASAKKWMAALREKYKGLPLEEVQKAFHATSGAGHVQQNVANWRQAAEEAGAPEQQRRQEVMERIQGLQQKYAHLDEPEEAAEPPNPAVQLENLLNQHFPGRRGQPAQAVPASQSPGLQQAQPAAAGAQPAANAQPVNPKPAAKPAKSSGDLRQWFKDKGGNAGHLRQLFDQGKLTPDDIANWQAMAKDPVNKQYAGQLPDNIGQPQKPAPTAQIVHQTRPAKPAADPNWLQRKLAAVGEVAKDAGRTALKPVEAAARGIGKLAGVPYDRPEGERKRVVHVSQLGVNDLLNRIKKTPDGKFSFRHSKGVQTFSSKPEAEQWLRAVHKKALQSAQAKGQQAGPAKLSLYVPVRIDEEEVASIDATPKKPAIERIVERDANGLISKITERQL